MNDNWLKELQQLYQADKINQQAQTAQLQEAARQQNEAADLLRQHKAHELLRLVQKNLLAGKGQLTVVEKPRKFDRAIVLAWQGPVSDARRPNPNSGKDYHYILIAVKNKQVWVNNQPVYPATADALQAALLQAAKNPAVKQPGKNSKL